MNVLTAMLQTVAGRTLRWSRSACSAQVHWWVWLSPLAGKKPRFLLAMLGFILTYIPLVLGFLPYLDEMVPTGRSQSRINKVILPE